MLSIKTSLVFRLVAAVGAIVVHVGHTEAQDQPASDSRPVLAPAKPGLLPVPLPSLDGMEPAVADQIRSFQKLSTELIAREGADDDDLSNAYGALGQLYHAYELNESAEACYQNAHQLAPQDHRWPHLLGYLSEQAGQLQEAADYYKKVRQLRPDDSAAAARLGNVFLQLNRTDDARNMFQAALKIDPDHAVAHASLGEAALADRKYAEAIECFEKALKKVPAANKLHYSLGMAYRGLGDLEQARWHLERRGKVGVRPVDPLVDGLEELLRGERVQMIRGQLAFNAGRYQEAARAFTAAVEADPDSTRARVNLGTTLAKLGDPEGAVRQYQEVVRRDPDNATAHFNLATFMLRQDKPNVAMRHLREVLRIQPADAEANYELGKLLDRAGRGNEAVGYFLRAAKLRPDHENVVLDLCSLLVRQRRYAEALDYLERGHRQSPDRGLTAHALARLLAACPDVSLRDGQRALDLATKVYRARGTITHGETVAQALAELGRCEEAAQWQRRLITAAERANDGALAARLKNDLRRYEAGPPCRPPAK